MVAFLYLICLVGLSFGVVVRYYWRRKLLDRHLTDKSVLGLANLPVSYLDKKKNKVKTMWLTPNGFVVYAALVKHIHSMRHGMCTDSTSWSQFALLAAAAGYRRAALKKKNKLLLVSDMLAQEIVMMVMPYTRWVFRKVKTRTRIDADLAESYQLHKIRGVPGREIMSLASGKVRVVSLGS